MLRLRCGSARAARPGWLSIVWRISLWSLRLAPSMASPDRHAAAVGQQAALHPALAAVGRVGAGFFPRPAAPWSSPRPSPARPSRCPAARRRPAAPRPELPQTPRPRSTPGSAGAPRRTGADARGVQRIPLAARPQHEEDRVHRRPVRHPRVVAAQRVRRPRRQQRLHLGPQRVRQPPAIIPNAPSLGRPIRTLCHAQNWSFRTQIYLPSSTATENRPALCHRGKSLS